MRKVLTISEEMVEFWKQHVGQKVLHLTEERKSQLKSLFAFHFQNDMRLWERFCLRVKAAPFLMGEGPNKWNVSLDWILRDGSVLKVLEGNYDDLDRCDQEDFREGEVNSVRHAEKAAILGSIKDPVWRNWCSRLAEGIRLNERKMLQPPLSHAELQEIANAYFIECEDEKLVWVGSNNSKVLKKIEELCLKINWVFAKEYPKARTFRTNLEPPNSSRHTPFHQSHPTDPFGPKDEVKKQKGALHAE